MNWIIGDGAHPGLSRWPPYQVRMSYYFLAAAMASSSSTTASVRRSSGYRIEPAVDEEARRAFDLQAHALVELRLYQLACESNPGRCQTSRIQFQRTGMFFQLLRLGGLRLVEGVVIFPILALGFGAMSSFRAFCACECMGSGVSL